MTCFKKGYRAYILTVLVLILTLFFSGCGESSNTISSLNMITSFKFSADLNDQLNSNVSGTISGSTIVVTMPYGTDTQNLVASYSAIGKTVTVNDTVQSSGNTINDFSDTVIYTVTAEDNSKRDYTVTVTVPEAPSSDKEITAFSINGTEATINGEDIDLTLASGTDPTALVAIFTTTGVAVAVNETVQVDEVTANDFTDTVIYIVTAEDGSKKDYSVTITIPEEPSSDKDITAFSINGTNATISETDINLTFASGTDPTALVATFTTTGVAVAVNETVQESEVTANDFTDTVIYIVTAEDGSEKDYSVTITIPEEPSSDKDITAFSINGAEATINGEDIELTLTLGTDPTALVAAFTTTGETVAVNGTAQASGDTANDFIEPVIYTVTAEDNSQKDYTVTVIISSSPIASIVADHTIMNMVWEDQIPVLAIENAKSNLHIAYGHTSHGSQITRGMSNLDNFKGNTGLYDWNNGGNESALDLHDYFMSGDLGHNGSTTWANSTRTYLDNPANSDVNVVMWSWCRGVSDNSEAGINIYLNTMSDLESEYENVQFVYMTGHLDGSGLSGNLHRGNEQIREYCRVNNKILYDFADIESYDLDGNYFGDKYGTDGCNYDFNNDGHTSEAGDPALPTNNDKNWAIEWQDNHTQNEDWYSCGSAHSQPLNANQKAYAAWWLWARLAGWDGTP